METIIQLLVNLVVKYIHDTLVVVEMVSIGNVNYLLQLTHSPVELPP